MRKRIVSILLVVIMLIGMMPFSAFAGDDETGKYLDASGVEQNIPDADAITSDTTELIQGWYTVSGNVEIERHIDLVGDVHIVLMDGSNLTIQGGVVLTGTFTSLTIYAQQAGTGKLTVTYVPDSRAGIGSDINGSCGNITINGGIVAVNGGSYGAGIGSGSSGSCGNITINGGVVTATGGLYGAGIGSGNSGSCGNITISGGTNTVTGYNGGAGIGSGRSGSCGNITISGGTNKASGGGQAGGIGSGQNGSCRNITINNGNIIATDTANGAGIGSGMHSSCSDIVINGGYVIATAGVNGSGIGCAVGGTCGNITITSGYVDACCLASGATIGNRDGKGHGVITIVPRNYEDSFHRCVNCEYIYEETEAVCYKYAHPAFYHNLVDGKYYKEMPFTNSNVIGETIDEAIYAVRRGDKLPHISILVDAGYHRCLVCGELEKHNFDESGKCACGVCNTGADENRFMCPDTETGELVSLYAPVTPTEITTGGNYGPGWYIFRGEQTINERITFAGDIFENDFNSATYLILADDADITVIGGIGVINNSLVILSQSVGNNSGKLTVKDVPNGCAGIGAGSNYNDLCVLLIINGGRITATGGEGSSALGGGSAGACSRIIINGGSIRTKVEGNIPAVGKGSSGYATSVDYAPYCKSTNIDDWYCVNLMFVEAAQPTCAEAGHAAYYADLWNHVYYTDFSLAEDKLIGDDVALAKWLSKGGAGYAGDPLEHKDDNHDKFCDSCGGYFYYDIDSSTLERKEDVRLVTEINSSVNDVELTSGWYGVKGNVEISGSLTINGDVHLILADGSALNVKKGVILTEGNSLTIYVQSFGNNMGRMTATGNLVGGPIFSAGIGGYFSEDRSCSSGQLTINGGNITATGGLYSAGIGGSSTTDCGKVTINAGNVTAIGGLDAAGIGGGEGGNLTELTINGDSFVTARGNGNGFGIGGGVNGNGGEVQINSGVAIVYGGEKSAAFGKDSQVRLGYSMAVYEIVDKPLSYDPSRTKEVLGDKLDINAAVGTCKKMMIQKVTPSDGPEGPIPTYPEIPHEHLGILQSGVAPTRDTAGYKDFYICSCGKFFEDQFCTVEITDLNAWVSVGGRGYLAPVSGGGSHSGGNKKPIITINDFCVDVDETDYYHDAVLWAYENNITDGIDNLHFGPASTVTRGQVVTFLWRAAGCPVVNYWMNLKDVPSGQYYSEAVRWALSEGITTGTSENTFDPDKVCTRAEIVTFLWRYAKKPVVDYWMLMEDVPSGQYYSEAIRWALSEKITEGTSKTTFSPAGDCTRAQMVTFLYRFVK